MQIFLSIAPVFVLICLGYVLRRGGIPSTEFWNLNDRLVYFLLMPALFFTRISTADLSDAALLPLSATLYVGVFAAMLAGLIAARILRVGRPVVTDIFQGSARFNTFVGLAVAEALYGLPGLQNAVLSAAILVPGVNILVIMVFALYLPQPGARPVISTLRGLVTNPLILSIVAGIAANLADLGEVPVLHDSLSILGAAALPIMLLCVGANLKLRGLSAELGPILVTSLFKLGLFPAVVMGLAILLDLSPLQAQVALIMAALPTGVAAYTMARQLGGTAPLMAAIITIQTALSFVALPLWIALGERVLLGL